MTTFGDDLGQQGSRSPPGGPPPLPDQAPRRFWTPAKIVGFSVGGGIVLVSTIVILVMMGTTGDNKSRPGHDWGRPVKIAKNGTEFEVGFTAAWWKKKEINEFGFVDDKNYKELVVVYRYKNLGPRESSFSFGDVEIMTNQGHLYREGWFFMDFVGKSRPRHQIGWWPTGSTTTIPINSTGEDALTFRIPEAEDPVEIRSKQLTATLPNASNIPIRKFSREFGFLPEDPRVTVNGLLGVLNDETAKHDCWRDALEELGNLGPAAKAAVPTLLKIMNEERFYSDDARTALGKISPESLRPTTKPAPRPTRPR